MERRFQMSDIRKLFLLFSLLFIFVNYSLARVNINSSSLKILERGKVSVFIGDVHITAPNLVVTARKAVSREQEGIIEAEGDVYVKYSSTTWNIEAWCRELKIISEAQSLIMTGNAKAIYGSDDSSSNDVTEVYADRIEFNYSGRQEASFEGNVRVERNKMTVFSNKAFYSKKDERIEFTDSPKAVSLAGGVKSEYSGDSISLFIEDEKIKISGSAHAVVFHK